MRLLATVRDSDTPTFEKTLIIGIPPMAVVEQFQNFPGIVVLV